LKTKDKRLKIEDSRGFNLHLQSSVAQKECTTMTITFRIADPEADYPALVEMLNLDEPEPITAVQLREWDSPAASKIRRRRIAVQDGEIIGYSFVGHDKFESDGRYTLSVVVHPQHRRQGLGAQLYNEILAFAHAQNATLLVTDVRDNAPHSLRFAEAYGFQIVHHFFESLIDLRTFDPAPYARLVEAVTATGVRFTSLAAEGDTETARRKLHQLNYETYLEDPGSTGEFPDFDAFNHMFNTVEWFRAAGQLLAVDGEHYVGLAAVGYFAHTNSMYNMMTGVDPAYRGRKIAQALKLLTIQYAQECGASYIRTHNNSNNQPMLAINRKLGYQPRQGVYRLEKELVAGSG
jgi:ribosomal protein S18 acetylase RimI-like enzyme